MQKLPSTGLIFAATSLLLTLGAARAVATPLDLASLASGTALPLPSPSARPFMVSGAKVAAGMQVVNVGRFSSPVPGYQEHTLFAEPERARAFEAELKNGTPPAFARSDVCFATASNFRANEAEAANVPAPEWDALTAERFTAQSFPNDTSAKVVPLRAERWSEANGKVRLETTVAWVDLRTAGTQLIAHTDNELQLIASPYAGVAIYAMRSGPAAVSFVVRRDAPRNPASPDANPLARLGFAHVGSVNVSPFDLGVFHTTVQAQTHVNPCAFEHIELESRPDAPAQKSPTETKTRRPRASKSLSVALVPPREVANVVFAVVLDLETEPAPPAGGSANGQPSFDPRTIARVRTMVVNLGLAHSPNGGAPVPSVSYRWLERQRAVSF